MNICSSGVLLLLAKPSAKDPSGKEINALEQHIKNLLSPSTPLFFNTLDDPADFVQGYPFSMREGVPTAVSHGLWLNIPDYDAPTHLVKPSERNTRYKVKLSLLWNLIVTSGCNICSFLVCWCSDDLAEGSSLPDVWYEYGIWPWTHWACNILWTHGRWSAN